MRHAAFSDRNNIINIIADSFARNPSVNWVIKQDERKSKRLLVFSAYAFETGMGRKGMYISDAGNGVAICFKKNSKYNILKDLYWQARMAIQVVGLLRVKAILDRESYLEKIRPSDGNYYYFWFFGVLTDERNQGDALDLKNELLAKADREKKSIFLETSVPKNMRVYQRYGFEIYHSWEVESEGITLWCMKREPK
ncbi:MAG: GNAT family N-acetyltransferase [Cyclobacteriaceae bacterium]